MYQFHSLHRSQNRLLLLAGSILWLAGITPALAQQVTLSLGSGMTTPGSSVALTASIASTGGALPTAIQWTMSYPADVTSVVVTANQKSISCASGTSATICVLYSLNADPIAAGAVATATFAISGSSTNASVPITLSGIVTSDPGGNSIPSSGTNGIITVVPPTPVTPSTLTCSPSSVNAPGSSVCTATLSAAAPTGGLAVALSSNNANVTVPASVTVASGSTSGSFAVTVGTIAANQTASISAGANGTSHSFALNLVAPVQLTGVVCAPATVAGGASSTCTVSLNKSPASATLIAVNSNAAVVAVPGSVTIPAGQSGTTFQAAVGTVSANQSALITASLNGQSQSATLSLVSPPVPTAVSVLPSASAGTTQTFTFVFSDSQSAANLADAAILFAPSLSYANSCFVIYDRNQGTFQLEWDGVNGADAKPVNSTVTLQNSQCMIGATTVTASALSNTITVAITFKSSFSGLKNIYMYGADNTGTINTGWVQRGTYTVATPTAPVPSVDSVSPSAGAGTTQTFAFVFSDSQSAANLADAAILFAPSLSYPNTCFIIYDQNRGTVQLEYDGAIGADMKPIGSTVTLQNSQCAIGATAITTSALTNTITMDITFKSAFSGVKNIYMYGADNNGTVNTGWVQKGTYAVTTVSAPMPTADSVSPSGSGGPNQLFTFVFSDSQSAANLSAAAILFAPSLSYANSCFVIYDRNRGTLQLEWDNVGGADEKPVNSTVTLQNSQCSIGATTVTTSAFSTTITIDIAFHSAFSGLKNIYLYGADTDGTINTGWVQRGTWTPF